MKYNRILLKLSGEALAGSKGFGIDSEVLNNVSKQIKELTDSGTQVAVVIGGGNIHRGVAGSSKGMDRTRSDHMGMLATIINGLAMQDSFIQHGMKVRVYSGIDMPTVAEIFQQRKAVADLKNGMVVIFAGGTGNPYFTTDTAAALRATEIHADVVMKATKVDGVYDKDPVKFKDAIKYDKVSFSDALSQGLKIMDAAAFSLCRDNEIDILVFDMFEEGNILRAVKSGDIGTIITKENN